MFNLNPHPNNIHNFHLFQNYNQLNQQIHSHVILVSISQNKDLNAVYVRVRDSSMGIILWLSLWMIFLVRILWGVLMGRKGVRGRVMIFKVVKVVRG
jgi:hypothetical protein